MAELERPVVTIWSRRDMNELSSLQHVDSVPFAFRYDARVARMQFNGCVRCGLSSDPDTARNHVEDLVPIRVDFTSVRCVILNRDDAHGQAIDSDRRTRLVFAGVDGKVASNVEEITRNVDWDNAFQGILLW